MPKQRHQIKAVYFDLGETLLNFGRFHKTPLFRKGARLSYEYLKSLGQPVPNFEYYFWRNMLNLRWNVWKSNRTGNDFDSLTLLKKFDESKGDKLTSAHWDQLVWLWYKPLTEICQTEPDIVETFTKLKDQGLKLGILSNTFVRGCALEKHLDQIGILDFLDVKMYSYQFKFRKPDPRIFQAASEKIGLPLENILYIGDRIDNDIEPTLKLGMTAVLKDAYTNLGQIPPTAAHRITRVAQLPGLIEELNAQLLAV